MFDNVTFSYEGQKNSALKNIRLLIPNGKITALVGPSGSGKSSILNLIPRFYDPKSGAVRIGSQNIRHLTMQSLRSKIALVNQEPILFDMSIKDNILYGNPNASDQEIEDASRASASNEFITKLPEGYKTIIVEMDIVYQEGKNKGYH